MSGSVQADAPTTKAVVADGQDTTKPLQARKDAAQLQEDDEFEDFPVEDWPADQELSAQTAAAPGTVGQTGPGGQPATTHLWEESWDDDDTSDDFASQLKAELEKAKK